jgi:hypothetical protein
MNHHSPAYRDGSTDSRHWRGQLCRHYESSLWAAYAEIRVTFNPIRSCCTVGTPVLVWSLFRSGRRQHYESPVTVSPVQITLGPEPTQGSMPWPHESTETVGSNETSASASARCSRYSSWWHKLLVRIEPQLTRLVSEICHSPTALGECVIRFLPASFMTLAKFLTLFKFCRVTRASQNIHSLWGLRWTASYTHAMLPGIWKVPGLPGGNATYAFTVSRLFFFAILNYCVPFEFSLGLNDRTWPQVYEGVSKSFRTGRLERDLQMAQLSATRCSCISILWVSVVSFAAISLSVPFQRVFIVFVYFVIDSVWKLLDTP